MGRVNIQFALGRADLSAGTKVLKVPCFNHPSGTKAENLYIYFISYLKLNIYEELRC